jgi:hypothetical protein
MSAAQRAGLHLVSVSEGELVDEVVEEGMSPRYMHMQSMQ